MATKYIGSEIKSMCIDYVERMHDASQKSVVDVDLKKEFLVVKLTKADLDNMMNVSGFNGLFCLLGIEGGKQTVTLVPYDSSNKALPIDSSGIIKGVEDWSPESYNLNDVVFPNDPHTKEIGVGVTNVLSNLGIL